MAEPTGNSAGSPRLERESQVALRSAVLSIAATRDGSMLLAACMDGRVSRVEVAGGATQELGQHESYASGVVLLPDGRTVVSGGYDGFLIWWDLPSGKPIRRVRAHQFWSWDLAASPDGRWVASVTGRYDAGGYRYEPAPEIEPSVRVYHASTGELAFSFSHVPCVQSVAISPDSRHVAAGNLMGEVRVWDLESGKEVSRFTTPDFTSWGIIKSHHYLGGIFALEFGPGPEELLVCGMGPMRDPMAGNGTQRWQRYRWQDGTKLAEPSADEVGRGLMEALAIHPTGRSFAMGGRLVQGSWNLAVFDFATGRNLHSLDAKHRITGLRWSVDGRRLFVSKAQPQEKPKDGRWPDFGLLEVYRFVESA